jgi:hypothetical protein
MVDQVADLFRTTHKVKTQQVVKSRGQHCGDIELVGYLANEAGPLPLVLDLRIAHDRVGSSTDPTLNGHLCYPNKLDQSLNDTTADKIRKYRTDYNNNPPNTETDRFFAASGVQLAQTDRGVSHYRREAFSSMLKNKVGLTLAKAAALRTKLRLI